MIAKVIVDVAVNQTDRVFDYLVPPEYEETIVPGIRVNVSFGPRKVQGFVLDTEEHSDYDLKKLKPLDELIDLYPPLTKELIELSKWLKDDTLSFHISVLKSMLPAAMRAKYQKKLSVNSVDEFDQLPIMLQHIFKDKKEIENWDEWQKHATKDETKQMMKAVKDKLLVVTPLVKTNDKKKTQMVISTVLTKEELEKSIIGLARAEKQKQLVEFVLNNFQRGEKVPLIQLLEQANVSRQTVQELVKKQLLTKEEIVVGRDPYEGRTFQSTEALTLMEEQQQALDPVVASIQEQRHETFLLRGVTGSGKTEVYLQAIDVALKKGKEAIVLVPEISLTPQMVTRFKGRFGSRVAVLHSALSKGEKYDEWLKIREK
jgi:primosomal protein N' (replication factor Y)